MSERCGYGLLHVDGPCVYCERDEARAALAEEKRRADDLAEDARIGSCEEGDCGRCNRCRRNDFAGIYRELLEEQKAHATTRSELDEEKRAHEEHANELERGLEAVMGQRDQHEVEAKNACEKIRILQRVLGEECEERREAERRAEEAEARAVCLAGERDGWQRSAEVAARRAEEAERERDRLRIETVGGFASVGVGMLVEADPTGPGEIKRAIRQLASERDALAARLAEAVGVLRVIRQGGCDHVVGFNDDATCADAEPPRRRWCDPCLANRFLASLAPETTP